jgi:hypothetical protein
MTRTYSYRLPSNAEVYIKEADDDHEVSAGAEKEGLTTRQEEKLRFAESLRPSGRLLRWCSTR